MILRTSTKARFQYFSPSDEVSMPLEVAELI